MNKFRSRKWLLVSTVQCYIMVVLPFDYITSAEFVALTVTNIGAYSLANVIEARK